MESYSYLMNTRLLHSAMEVLLAHDVKPAALLKRLGVPPFVLLNPDAWVPNRLTLALANEAARAIGDPFYGLHAGELFRFERTGTWGESILRAPTVRAALEACIRNVRFCQTDVVLRLHEEGRSAHFTIQILGHGPDDARHYYEAGLALFPKILALSGEQMSVTGWMKHARPRRASEFERVLGPSLKFNAPHYALVFDRDLLDLPLQDNPNRSSSAPSPAKWTSADPVARAALRAIVETIEDESATIVRTATKLGFHVRTFQRHLERWGMTFEMLLDDFRRERAIHLLRTASHTVTDIALLLGYSDLPHFSRAFRRWTGMAPRDYIMQVREAPSSDPMAYQVARFSSATASPIGQLKHPV